MNNIFLIFLGKMISWVSRIIGKGNGSTWPGYIVRTLDPQIITHLAQKNPQTQIIAVTGTNGKTTTSMLLAQMLEKAGKKVFYTQSGANLMNGITTGFLQASSLTGQIPYDVLLFEVDENVLPLLVEQVEPTLILVLNLFRDQLDRYGELQSIAKKWIATFNKLEKTKLVVNADDPLVAWLGIELAKRKIAAPSARNDILYFGLPVSAMKKTKIIHGADSTYCPNCETKLVYNAVAYSHIGDWQCTKCGLKRPKNRSWTSQDDIAYESALDGVYNQYNMHAAATAARELGVSSDEIVSALHEVHPAFGRQEKVLVKGKQVQIILSKNPTGTNQSVETVLEIESNKKHYSSSKARSSQTRSSNNKKPTVLFVLNDQIPDGTDVSWIWDTDMEQYAEKFGTIIVSGDRVYDMAVRFAYASENHAVAIEELPKAIAYGLSQIDANETFYILPTYSAMLEVRKILTGRAIL